LLSSSTNIDELDSLDSSWTVLVLRRHAPRIFPFSCELANTAPLAKEKKKLTLRHEWPEKTEDAFSTRKMKKTDI
jgi:hypothetical protein